MSVLFFDFENKSYIICQWSTSLTLFASYQQVLHYLPVIDKSYFICQLSTGLTLFVSYRQVLLYLPVIDRPCSDLVCEYPDVLIQWVLWYPWLHLSPSDGRLHGPVPYQPNTYLPSQLKNVAPANSGKSKHVVCVSGLLKFSVCQILSEITKPRIDWMF